jgi:hypothetical protein
MFHGVDGCEYALKGCEIGVCALIRPSQKVYFILRQSYLVRYNLRVKGRRLRVHRRAAKSVVEDTV